MAFFNPYKSGYLIRVKLTPNAGMCAVRGVWLGEGDEAYLKISVNAVPEKGKANKELIKFLSKALKIAAGRIEIISGATDHLKKLYLDIEQSAETTEKIRLLNKEEQ